MSNPTIFKSDDTFKIDNIHGIIAAGPVHRIDCGMLPDMFQRAVLRVNHEGSRYHVTIQTLTADGQHGNFDKATGLTFDVYKAAFKAFMEMMIEGHNFGFAYHDGDSENMRLKLEVVSS